MSRGLESSIDLTLVSAQLATTAKWDVIQDSTVGSDHYPIICEVGVGPVLLEGGSFPRWKLRKANWGAYSMMCSRKLEGLNQNNEGIDDFNARITEAMQSTAVEIIGKGSGSEQRHMVPWWTDECKKAVQARNKAFKKVKASFSFNDLIEYKKTQAVVRRVIRQAKRNQWQQFCNTIARETKISDVWGMMRRMGGIRREYALPAIRYNGEIMVTNKDKAEALAKSFAKIYSSANLTQEARAGRDEVIRVQPNTVRKNNDTAEASNVCFSLFELKRALAGVRNTSPGKDEIIKWWSI